MAGGRRRRLGFTDRVAEYLAACDLLVTKPGPHEVLDLIQSELASRLSLAAAASL